MKLLKKRIETWNGKKVVIFRPNPEVPREVALKRLEKLLDKVIARQSAS